MLYYANILAALKNNEEAIDAFNQVRHSPVVVVAGRPYADRGILFLYAFAGRWEDLLREVDEQGLAS